MRLIQHDHSGRERYQSEALSHQAHTWRATVINFEEFPLESNLTVSAPVSERIRGPLPNRYKMNADDNDARRGREFIRRQVRREIRYRRRDKVKGWRKEEKTRVKIVPRDGNALESSFAEVHTTRSDTRVEREYSFCRS